MLVGVRARVSTRVRVRIVNNGGQMVNNGESRLTVVRDGEWLTMVSDGSQWLLMVSKGY